MRAPDPTRIVPPRLAAIAPAVPPNPTFPGQGWYDDQNGEIGNICGWRTTQLGQDTAQSDWSNRQARYL